jgi:hypothetical protein
MNSYLMKLVIALAGTLGAGSAAMHLTAAPKAPEHVLVYREAGRFGGWPANHGIWNWGDEIVVGFSAAYSQKKPADRHQYNSGKPEEPRLARSLDGGRTWNIEAPPSLLPPEQGGAAVRELREPMDFRHPDFAMTIRFTSTDRGPSRLYYSMDRGKSWAGPYQFPLLGQSGIAARTDYMIEGKRQALVFLTASKKNGRQGRPLCARTIDGGLNWELVSWIGEEPKDFAIMPSTVRLSAKELLTTVRCKQGEKDWIDAYWSGDNGTAWKFLNRPVPYTGGMGGNPPSLIRLRDGRLALTYGYRGRPYGIRARLSDDRGKSWSHEIVLRDDGATWEVGYPRSAQRPDGKIVTVYYIAENADTERVIMATIWDPGER